MKVLYALQGTGNGHVSRARDLVPALAKYYDVDVLISGTESNIELNYPIKYRRNGLSFVFGTEGGINIWATLKRSKLFRFWRDLKSIPVENYDFVINDFEPLTARACLKKNVPIVACSHQFSLLLQNVPKPDKSDFLGKLILKYYAPVEKGIGMHFKGYNEQITPPIIRNEIQELVTTDEGFYLVYLPSYGDKKIIKILSQLPHKKWVVFSKHSSEAYTSKNVSIFPVDTQQFLTHFAKCTGVLCGAGFETPAETLYLRKKLFIIPMIGQYEQHCNAEALHQLGIPMAQKLNSDSIPVLNKWVNEKQTISIDLQWSSYRTIQKIQSIHFL